MNAKIGWSCTLGVAITLAGIFLGVYFGCGYPASWSVAGVQPANKVDSEQKSTIPQEIISCETKMNGVPQEEFSSRATAWEPIPIGNLAAQNLEKVPSGPPGDDSVSPALTLIRLPGQVVILPPEEELLKPPPTELFGLSSTGQTVVGMPPAGLTEESELLEFPMPLVHDELTAPMPYATEKNHGDQGTETSQDPEVLPFPQCLEMESLRYSPKGTKNRVFEESQLRSLVPELPRCGTKDLKTRHFDVDTLEFRPTDAGFPRDLRGPF